MSVLGKKWQIKNADTSLPLLQKLLANRNLKTPDEIERFLNPSRERDFHDPFLMEDMEKAVERIGRAIDLGERIMIFGDYDVDGITGSAILMRSLTKLGAKVSYRLPHRVEDGYGLREKFIREFHSLDVKVAITVDNGISAFNEVEIANSLGIDVIISDHHTVPAKIPNAHAILHPKLPNTKYPFSELTGSAVALKLAQALFMRRTENHEEHTTPLLDLACMGTITDFGELKGENRYIVREGLRVLAQTRWPGLSRLKRISGINNSNPMSTYDIGFLIGPRINAAGRISHPSDALKLLLNDSAQGDILAAALEDLNRKRQKLTEELMEVALQCAEGQAKNPVLIVHHSKFHTGIIGLLAAKLVEKFSKPVIVMEQRKENLVGSCRSVEGVSIVQALTNCAQHMTHFGGHAMAAGFEIERTNLEAFKEDMQKQIGLQRKANKDSAPVLSIECMIDESDVTMQTAEMIQALAPFGVGNEQPRFLLKNFAPHRPSLIGKNKTHIKMTGKINGADVDVVGFGFGKHFLHFRETPRMDIVCEIEKNTWNGRSKPQLKIVDFKE